MKRENFYRRDPMKALAGMTGLSLEEKAVYNTLIDLMYATWRPVQDNRAFIAGWAGCAVQKLNPIIKRLIEKRRIVRVIEDGQAYLTDDAFEKERRSVKGAKPPPGQAEVGEKSGEVGEKSEKPASSPRPAEADVNENRVLDPLEERREEEDKNGGVVGASTPVLVAVSDWPEGDSTAHAKRLFEMVGSSFLDPNRSSALITTVGRLAAWRRDGASWEHDVVPVVTGLCAGRRSPVSSWNFFNEAIARSISDNRQALTIPEAHRQTHGRRDHHSSFADNLDNAYAGSQIAIDARR